MLTVWIVKDRKKTLIYDRDDETDEEKFKYRNALNKRRSLIQFSKLWVSAFSRVGAYSRQRFGGACSIIMCLGWVLIRGWALF